MSDLGDSSALSLVSGQLHQSHMGRRGLFHVRSSDFLDIVATSIIDDDDLPLQQKLRSVVLYNCNGRGDFPLRSVQADEINLHAVSV